MIWAITENFNSAKFSRRIDRDPHLKLKTPKSAWAQNQFCAQSKSVSTAFVLRACWLNQVWVSDVDTELVSTCVSQKWRPPSVADLDYMIQWKCLKWIVGWSALLHLRLH